MNLDRNEDVYHGCDQECGNVSSSKYSKCLMGSRKAEYRIF